MDLPPGDGENFLFFSSFSRPRFRTAPSKMDPRALVIFSSPPPFPFGGEGLNVEVEVPESCPFPFFFPGADERARDAADRNSPNKAEASSAGLFLSSFPLSPPLGTAKVSPGRLKN